MGTEADERTPLDALLSNIAAREPLGQGASPERLVHRAGGRAAALYRNANGRLGIDFAVERIDFAGIQAMDPRIVRIAPGHRNEHHRHAHESIFVVLGGRGCVRVGDAWVDVRAGDVAFVPRWIFHQTENTSAAEELVLLAVTDFGLTRAALGDYDRRTRLRAGGEDSLPRRAEEVA